MFSAFKLISFLYVPGEKNYFQRDNDLVNKKIQSIVYLPSVVPPIWSGICHGISDDSVIDKNKSGYRVNIFLTTDGQRYDYVNNLAYLDPNQTNGVFSDVNRVLDLENCYLYDGETGTNLLEIDPTLTKPFLITLGVFYEDVSICTQSVRSKLSKHKSLSQIVIPKNSSAVNFSFFDDPNLKSALLRNLTFTDTLYNAFDNDYNKVVSSCFLTLCNGTRIIWRDMPIILLAQVLYLYPLKFDNLRFSLADSYITFDKYFNYSSVIKDIPINFILEYVEE